MRKKTYTCIVALLSTFIISACEKQAEKPFRNTEYIDYSPAYSPDGSKIAYVSEKTGNKDIFIINADGTGETQITFEGSDEQQPIWSPDGTKIAICSNKNGNEEIYVMNTDGSNPVNITNHPADECDSGWSPDGTRILFKSNRDGDWKNNKEDNWELYVMDADGSNQTRLTDTPGYELSTGQAWSPDGSQIVFCSTMDKKFFKGKNQYDDFDLYIMDADGTNVRRLTFTEGQESYAYWSPDGKRISYTHVEKDAPIEAHGGENYEIYTIRPDGTDITRLTNHPGFDFEGWWSPDSKTMVYSSGEESPQAIYIMNADGSNKVRLTNKK